MWMNQEGKEGQKYRRSMYENDYFGGKETLEWFYWTEETFGGRTEVRKEDYKKWGVELSVEDTSSFWSRLFGPPSFWFPPAEATITGEPEPMPPVVIPAPPATEATSASSFDVESTGIISIAVPVSPSPTAEPICE